MAALPMAGSRKRRSGVNVTAIRTAMGAMRMRKAPTVRRRMSAVVRSSGVAPRTTAASRSAASRCAFATRARSAAPALAASSHTSKIAPRLARGIGTPRMTASVGAMSICCARPVVPGRMPRPARTSGTSITSGSSPPWPPASVWP